MWVTVDEDVRGTDLYTGEELDPIRVRDPATLDQGIQLSSRIATGLDAVWVGYSDGYLSRYDVETGEVTTGRVGDEIDSIVVGDGLVWLGDRFDDAVTTFDPRTGTTHEIDLGVVSPDELVFEEATGKVWALDLSSDLIVSIDRDGPGRTITVGSDPTDIAVGLGSVWVTDLDGVLRRVDTTTGTVTEVVDAGLPLWAVGVDEETGLVWLDLSPPPQRR
jgi:streptogramin lyase